MRPYLTLLRLPYQLQLGPIFGWGYLLAGGRWSEPGQVLHSLLIFALYHAGALGGATALNSFYDRDTGPIGGLWQPPEPPERLWQFAWMVQLGGLLLLLPFGLVLCVLYALILLLSLGYSHPRTRWKGKPLGSLVTVVLGQGALDFLAGALAWNSVAGKDIALAPAQWWGMAGAMLFVAAMYPLTQLYQIEDDKERGDTTVAVWLEGIAGRRVLFFRSAVLMMLGAICNTVAAVNALGFIDVMVQIAFGTVGVLYLWQWSQIGLASQKTDFTRVHRLMLMTALGFGGYIVFRLIFPAR